MVDTLALGASGSNPMEVQVLSSAPRIEKTTRQKAGGFLYPHTIFFFVKSSV